MSDKVLVRPGHGYYKGGITPLPNVCPTIAAHIDCWHILIGEKMEDIKCECVGMLGGEKYKKMHDIARRVYDTNGIAPTQLENVSRALRTFDNAGVSTKHYIRKLTPKECGRLMGVRDEDIDKMSVNQSNSSLYHCFGDALVTTVMGAIFCNMMDTPLSFDEMIKSLYNSPNR